ncbi:MAG: hypothetical protein AAGM22_27370, partial [Acidobacteriota bacterium]
LAAKVGVVENFERRAAAQRSGPVFAIQLEEFEENFHVPSMDAIPKQRFLESLGSNDASVKVLAENQVRKNRLTGERFSMVYSITVNGSEYLKLSDMTLIDDREHRLGGWMAIVAGGLGVFMMFYRGDLRVARRSVNGGVLHRRQANC